MKINENLYICSYFFLCFKYAYAQEYYHITAKNGLNVRESPNLSSKKIAKIPFGFVVGKIENTNKELTVKDEGREFKGSWIKVNFDHYPYSTHEGFVFSGFLKPMKRQGLTVETNPITKSKFLNLKKTLALKAQYSKKIEDLDTIKILLKDRVKWQKWDADSEDEETVVKHIITKNKQKIIYGAHVSDAIFSDDHSGYYPKEQILVLEGGHSSDVSVSIKNGGETATVGNPEYIVSSHRTNYRLNGYFGGQSCVSYFLEKRINDIFTFFSELDFFQNIDNCYFEQFYWIEENQFIFSTIGYDDESKFEEHFTGKIVEKQ